MTGLQLAFKKFDLHLGIWGSPWVGFYQMEKFLTSYQFTRVLKNTLYLSFYSIFAGFPIPICFALLLNCVCNRHHKKIIQTITYMPHFISTVVIVGILLQIFNPRIGLYGIMTALITGEYPQDLIGSAQAFPHMYVWSGIWQEFGWNSIVYIAALSSVSEELHDAAQIDGASRFQRMLHIDFPGILPVMTIMLILRTGSIMSIGFEKIYLMQNALNISASEVISTYVYKVGFGATGYGTAALPDYAYATAIGLFNSVINLTLISSTNFLSRRMGDTSLW
jgi:putative aldouronate transport system permease protein